VTVVILARDLMVASRIAGAAARAGLDARRIASIDELPEPGEPVVLFAAWDEREPTWGPRLAAWVAGASAGGGGSRLVLFGPHTDVAAHREARSLGIGPVLARSRLMTALPALLVGARPGGGG
jgi:GNAT superfamily N-acetyltransferase